MLIRSGVSGGEGVVVWWCLLIEKYFFDEVSSSEKNY